MRRKSVLWIPVLLLGSTLYWTLAFGFGGLSLMTLTQFEIGPDTPDWAVKDSYQSITVNLSELQERGEQHDQKPASAKSDLVPGHESAVGDDSGEGARGGLARQGPGDTAF